MTNTSRGRPDLPWRRISLSARGGWLARFVVKPLWLLVPLLILSLMVPADSNAAKSTWLSGAYVGSIGDTATITDFGTYRGRPVGIANVYPERSTWAELRDDTWEVRRYSGLPGRLSIAVPLMPTDEPTTLQSIAAGDHDADFEQLASNLVNLGRGDSDIRLGWEFNGDWYGWSARDPSAFIDAYRRIAAIFRATSPKFSLDWNGNAVQSACGHNPFAELYPGDDVVDVVGVDAYDWSGTGVHDSASFVAWASTDQGIYAWLNFSHRHHKLFAVSEWGLVGNSNGEGDNIAFMLGMFNFFKSNRESLFYESYFNQPTGLQNSLHEPTELPLASIFYAYLWRDAPGDAPRTTGADAPGRTGER
jgi:hypothetical protein